MKQVVSGKSFEFGIANEFCRVLNKCHFVSNKDVKIARDYFQNIPNREREKIQVASSEIVAFLITHDNNISHDCKMRVEMQSDMKGREGDVRDIMLKNITKKIEVGLSVKNTHLFLMIIQNK